MVLAGADYLPWGGRYLNKGWWADSEVKCLFLCQLLGFKSRLVPFIRSDQLHLDGFPTIGLSMELDNRQTLFPCPDFRLYTLGRGVHN